MGVPAVKSVYGQLAGRNRLRRIVQQEKKRAGHSLLLRFHLKEKAKRRSWIPLTRLR